MVLEGGISMREISKPKYFTRILDTSNYNTNRSGEDLYSNVIKVFKSVVIGSDTEVNFYIDLFNAPCEEVVRFDNLH